MSRKIRIVRMHYNRWPRAIFYLMRRHKIKQDIIGIESFKRINERDRRIQFHRQLKSKREKDIKKPKSTQTSNQ